MTEGRVKNRETVRVLIAVLLAPLLGLLAVILRSVSSPPTVAASTGLSSGGHGCGEDVVAGSHFALCERLGAESDGRGMLDRITLRHAGVSGACHVGDSRRPAFAFDATAGACQLRTYDRGCGDGGRAGRCGKEAAGQRGDVIVGLTICALGDTAPDHRRPWRGGWQRDLHTYSCCAMIRTCRS
jgi:hypothetical protein